jgi:hypothetical protein
VFVFDQVVVWWQFYVDPALYTVKIGERLCDMGETLNPNPVVQHSGTGVCVMPSQEAGPYQFTLSEFDSYYGYGLAGIDSWLNQVSAVDGSLYTFIQHGDITGLSSSSSGMLGGALLTVYGSGFSYNVSKNVVLVAGLPCPVVSASATQLQCVIPPWDATATSVAGKTYPGGRGLFWEVRCVEVTLCLLFLFVPSISVLGETL